ncbi:MAG: carotenoid oxygenase family protein [Myxococcota bacterium]
MDFARYESVARAYSPVESEADEVLELRSGALPVALRGVLYRNGPGRLDIHGARQLHPFDGDGMVSRFAFQGGKVHYRNRYVRTREWLAEERAKKMLFRAFGTNVPGGFRRNALRLRFKNAANTSVVHHGGKLLALWEGGLPHRLHPESLATLGTEDFGGALQHEGLVPLDRLAAGVRPFSAHPKLCTETGSLYNFGLMPGAKPKLLIYRVSESGTLDETRVVPLRTSSFVHDFVLTEHHAVFFLTPVRFAVWKALLGLVSPVDAIERDPAAPLEILVVPRSGPPRWFEARGCFVFHFIHGYEEGDRIVVDGCRMDDFAGGTVDVQDPRALANLDVPVALPFRWEIDLGRRTVTGRPLSPIAMELPGIAVSRGRHRYGWGTASMEDPPGLIHHAIGKLDVDTGNVLRHSFEPDLPGEPVFVRRGLTEDDGWLLSVVYRAKEHRSDLVVLDAATLEEVACFALPHHHPPGFHGTFTRDPQMR